MYNPKTAARSISPLAQPLTPERYATLHTSARSRASWLLKNHAAQLEREVEAERTELTALQETLEEGLHQLRLTIKRRRHAVRLAQTRLDSLDAEHNALKKAVAARETRVAALRGEVENARRVRGLVSAEELARIESEAAEYLQNARGNLDTLAKEAFGSGVRHGHKSHANKSLVSA